MKKEELKSIRRFFTTNKIKKRFKKIINNTLKNGYIQIESNLLNEFH